MHRNLFRGIARLILSVSRVPLPRIGSFEFQHDGTISLTNRPLSCGMTILENDGAPRVMQRNDTYTCVEPYVSDMLTFHGGRFHAQPNAANHERDCRFQMAVQALLRASSFRYYDRRLTTWSPCDAVHRSPCEQHTVEYYQCHRSRVDMRPAA